MMESLRPLGIALALVLGATGIGFVAGGCAGEAQMQIGTPPPPPPPPAEPVDSDGDGINDADDKCPNEKEDGKPPDDKDGCPTTDPDGDGIAGDADKCPNEPETVNQFEDEDGCPDVKPAVEIKGLEIKINEKILFERGSATINEKSNDLIEKIANVIKANPGIDYIEIAGHASRTGDAFYNKNLSQRRAESVKNSLVKLGVAENRLRPAGYGFFCNLMQGETDQAHEANQRVEFKILRRDGKDTGVEWGGCEEAKQNKMSVQPIPAGAPKTEKK